VIEEIYFFLLSIKMIFPSTCALSNCNPFKMGDIPQVEGNTSSTGHKYLMVAL
jgi:hypothetical protein